MSWLNEIQFGPDGLVPVIAQDAVTGDVLMLAHANREALEKTLATGGAHYWSRSRQRIWRKGETSGHIQDVVEILVDCDADAVIYRVRQTGPACHTLEDTCFFRRVEGDGLSHASSRGHILARVSAIVEQRDRERPEGSYSTYLFQQGLDKILKKVGEENAEVIVAAKNGDNEELRAEVADLLFHVIVMLRARGLDPGEIWAELEDRFGAPTRVPPERSTEHPHS